MKYSSFFMTSTVICIDAPSAIFTRSEGEPSIFIGTSILEFNFISPW